MSDSIPTFNTSVVPTDTRYNRGEDNKQLEEAPIPVSVGLLDVDAAILKYLQDNITPLVTQDNKQIKVPVIYGNPERWKGVQRDGMLRDQNGKLQLPILMIRRTTMKKNSINNPTNKYQNYLFKTAWNQRNIYDKFTVLNKITPSEMFQTVTIPDYYDITYEAMIWTEYMAQMNHIIENISFESNEYWGEKNKYKFVTTISQFDQVDEVPVNNDRIVRSKFTLDVKAYILSPTMLNKDGRRTTTSRLQYGPKKVVFATEVVTGSLNP
jgi:hypothetical protein